ncbi:AAA family ATPase [Amedibacillus sp. YH-ame6]
MNYFRVGRHTINLKNKFLLVHDSWNDYWDFETLYALYYYDKKGICHNLGRVKIGNENMNGKSPDLPTEFQSLSDGFFSVGQSVDYYSNISRCLDELPDNPFQCLNDMAYDIDLIQKYKNESVTKTSLLRSISITEIKRQFHRIAHGGAKLTEYNFKYIFNVDDSDADLGENSLAINVEVGSKPPSNIHVLIGRNGVGKSRLLGSMVNTYLNENGVKGYFLNEEGIKKEPNSIFPNLLYMCYSAFDNTENVNSIEGELDEGSYFYLGLRKCIKDETYEDSEMKFLNKGLDELGEEFSDSLFNCKASVYKKEMLIKALTNLESDPIFKQANIKQILNLSDTKENRKKVSDFFRIKLSSGHGIILLTITKLVEMVEERTLILLDEPETHLHPPLLSSFVRCLSELLVKKNAVALIATHSPVVLQEVPSECVWKLDRSSKVSRISRPKIETFGENYGSLLEDVFGLEVQKSGFHTLLEETVNNVDSFEELYSVFDGKLGTDADIIARTLYMLKEDKEDD